MKQLFVILVMILCIIWLYNDIDTSNSKGASITSSNTEIEAYANDTICLVKADSV